MVDCPKKEIPVKGGTLTMNGDFTIQCVGVLCDEHGKCDVFKKHKEEVYYG
jgi:hypothetical protein